MDFTGVGLVDKSKLVKILQAIQLAELTNLYGALRGADESLRRSFCTFLASNPVKGADKALAQLSTVLDPLTAVRSAAVCLLAVRLEGHEN